MADRPEGPFKDALGKPLVDKFHNGAQPIDPFVFRDDDGQHYLYYGGWRHCNVARLTSDLLHLAPFPDGAIFKDITPANYVEGPFVFKRGAKYYLMWSEGGWQGPNYSVAYAIGDSPTGPFARVGKVLQQDPGVATGAGHHSVIPVPGSDTWYIVYHRRPLGTANGNHREVCIDEMRFNPDGTIQPVRITSRASRRERCRRVDSAARAFTRSRDTKGDAAEAASPFVCRGGRRQPAHVRQPTRACARLPPPTSRASPW